jgi:hypothetical protein
MTAFSDHCKNDAFGLSTNLGSISTNLGSFLYQTPGLTLDKAGGGSVLLFHVGGQF